jgi:hypothetical protein
MLPLVHSLLTVQEACSCVMRHLWWQPTQEQKHDYNSTLGYRDLDRKFDNSYESLSHFQISIKFSIFPIPKMTYFSIQTGHFLIQRTFSCQSGLKYSKIPFIQNS